jgi:hypothetical protein
MLAVVSGAVDAGTEAVSAGAVAVVVVSDVVVLDWQPASSAPLTSKVEKAVFMGSKAAKRRIGPKERWPLGLTIWLRLR